MKKGTVLINGNKWKYRRIPKAKFPDECSGFVAYADKVAKELTFSEEDFTLNTVTHELIHAYCRSLYLDSADIHWKDYEEIMAEMLGDKLFDIAERALIIYEALK